MPAAQGFPSLSAARAFLSRVRDARQDHYCAHGHHGCSDHDGGPCFDEVLNTYPELEDDA